MADDDGSSNGLGFTSGAAAAASLKSDGHGGSLLTFAGGLGKNNFEDGAPDSLHAHGFHTTKGQVPRT